MRKKQKILALVVSISIALLVGLYFIGAYFTSANFAVKQFQLAIENEKWPKSDQAF